jgi:hypothetical protein
MKLFLIITIGILLLANIRTSEQNSRLKRELKSRDFGNRYIKK